MKNNMRAMLLKMDISGLAEWLRQYGGAQAGYYPGLKKSRTFAERLFSKWSGLTMRFILDLQAGARMKGAFPLVSALDGRPSSSYVGGRTSAPQVDTDTCNWRCSDGWHPLMGA